MEWAQQCVLTSPPGDSDAHWRLRTTGSKKILWRRGVCSTSHAKGKNSMPVITLPSHWEKSWDWGFTNFTDEGLWWIPRHSGKKKSRLSPLGADERGFRAPETTYMWGHKSRFDALCVHSLTAPGAGQRGPVAFPLCEVWFPCAFLKGIMLPLRLHCRNMLSLSNGWHLSPLWSQSWLFGKLLATPSKPRQPVWGDSVEWFKV